MKILILAERIGAACYVDEGAESAEVTEVASYSLAGPCSLVFAEHPRYLEAALASSAAAVIVPEGVTVPSAPASSANGKLILRAKNPRLAFALASAELRREESRESGVAPSAVVDPSAEIHASALVGALAVVEAGVRIGARSRIGAGCVIGAGVVIGSDCELAPRVVVCSGTTLGDRVIVKGGAVLGSEGFGFVPDPESGRYYKFPQIGRLEIGNDVEIGANTTVDRGALDATVLADGVKLDNLVQVAHNVHLGRNVVVASQTGISGSSVLEDNVLVGGQVGIADHVRIEEGAILGAQCGVPSKKVVRGKGVIFWGTPARPIADYLRELATLARLARKKK
jgi:UDP-3-O-[3-hydroxymyristoyl] glucosamine N-acyltransferase